MHRTLSSLLVALATLLAVAVVGPAGQAEAALADTPPEIVSLTPITSPTITPGESVTFEVEYRDVLPDTFNEATEVVLEGRYRSDGVFEAHTLLTKCGSRYEAAPEELAG